MKVLKRDGVTVENFDVNKIEEAVRKAGAPNRLDIAIEVSLSLAGDEVTVESIQDKVEVVLMKEGLFDVAKHYILYREERSKLRTTKSPDPTAISNYIHASKYAKYIPELGRREVFAETVARVEAMHIGKFPELEYEIRWAFDLVREKKLLPSMRSMQFSGPAILTNNNRLYNCSASLIDRLDVFSEAFYLLLCGCGVGYSIQFEHVAKLPVIGVVDTSSVRHHVIEDTIEGWADALKALIRGFQDGVNTEFSYHLIRPAGSPLKMSGGRAPGHLKLKNTLECVRSVLKGAEGRKLSTLECHRIMCHAADAVLSGGIRRSAMIALFSPTDHEMINAKTGNWYETDPWFANSNNSAVLNRSTATKEEFRQVFNATRQWGDPGVLFSNNVDHCTNPCAEVGLHPTLGTKTGWAFCNLCEINAAKLTSYEDFMEVAKAATLIGTIQASYTSMPYLGSVSEDIAKRDALLGIGMTGMMDTPRIACNPEFQRNIAENVKLWNEKYAELVGINPAARTTLTKPSGTTSLELGGVASGHHPHHAKRYIRRVTADGLEYVFQAFQKVNPHMCVRKPDGKWVVEFPVETPGGATVRNDLSAIDFLHMIKSTQQNWVLPGTRDFVISPGLNHSVSNTVTVRPDEWDDVFEYIWMNRNYLTGIALLASSGDKDHAFAPMEEVVTEADERRWKQILDNYKPVDYTSMVESVDTTNLTSEPACAGGVCEIT